jgi:hypothetical protein
MALIAVFLEKWTDLFLEESHSFSIAFEAANRGRGEARSGQKRPEAWQMGHKSAGGIDSF